MAGRKSSMTGTGYLLFLQYLEHVHAHMHAHMYLTSPCAQSSKNVPCAGQTSKLRNTQSFDALSFLLSSKLILPTKAGAADTKETALSALGLNCLASVPSFFSPPSIPQKHVSRTYYPCYFGFLWVHLFWKNWRCWNGLVLHSPFTKGVLSPGHTHQGWPAG